MRAPPATSAVMSPVEIAYWLGCRRVVPTAAEIVQRTGCSRAAAYRWRAFARAFGRTASKRVCILPPATTDVLAAPPRATPEGSRKSIASDRISGALALGAASAYELSRLLDLPPSTTQSAIHQLHAAGLIHPASHIRHRPLSRTRGGAIRWALVARAPSVRHVGDNR